MIKNPFFDTGVFFLLSISLRGLIAETIRSVKFLSIEVKIVAVNLLFDFTCNTVIMSGLVVWIFI